MLGSERALQQFRPEEIGSAQGPADLQRLALPEQAELEVTGEEPVETPAGQGKAWIAQIRMAGLKGNTVTRPRVLEDSRRVLRQEVEVSPGGKLVTTR